MMALTLRGLPSCAVHSPRLGPSSSSPHRRPGASTVAAAATRRSSSSIDALGAGVVETELRRSSSGSGEDTGTDGGGGGRMARGVVSGTLATIMAVSPVLATTIAAIGFAVPPSAEAALSNPNTRLPRNGVTALRRAVPVINPEASEVQYKLEEAAYLLRIPQRKPWGQMSDDVKKSLVIVRDKRVTLLQPVPVGEARNAAESTLGELDQLLTELGTIAGAQDVERFDRGLAMALDATSRLRVLQAPGLPFDVPRRYVDLPRLTGRATVDLTVRKGGTGTFGFVNGDEVNTAKLRVVVDGYNAPLTAGNFVDLVQRGFYNNCDLKRSDTALLVDTKSGGAATAAAAAAADVVDGVVDGEGGVVVLGKSPREQLPLEVKPMDGYEPRYRSPLNVMGAEELPTLPLSVNGALAMARGAEDGTSSPTQFFVYQFDKRSAGLGGMAFEEGEFSVFGYVVQGEEEGFLAQLRTGDTIVKAEVVLGADRLVNGAR
uniref:PPIase cyclophilin-type domain-containing protein n=1 Tax=Mantoniella antarctica TaxID=81844 RepID=A0A7S0SIZ5_9CHLO|mmetsp:Transcript_26676/g.66818  ORF Transcript_26676/g.66818 Transcript_26676/m.66818 type:complete len:489 (+) Transcript_26676:173-1639(+)